MPRRRFRACSILASRVSCSNRRCARCSRRGCAGYRGRNGVFEALELKDEVYELVGPHADARAIDLAARRSGMTTMVEDAVAKCRAGATSAAEVLRVTTVR